MDRTAPARVAVTHRAVLAVAVPMTLAYLTTPLLGIVNTAGVGRMGLAAPIAGLAAGALVFDVVFSTFNFVRSGTTALVAQAGGRGDAGEEQAVLWRACLLGAAIGLGLLALAPLCSWAGQWAIGAAPDVNAALDLYVRIRLLGAPIALVNYAVLGYVLGRGEGRLALALQLVLNGVNILLSIVLGLSLGWGVAGVAWAAVAGEAAALLAGAAAVLGRSRGRPRLSLQRILDAAAFRRLMVLNRDIMIRTFLILAAFTLVARQGATFGTAVLAANGVLMNIFMVAAFFLDGFAAAAEQLAGKTVGARDEAALRRAALLCLVWGCALGLAAAAVILGFGAPVVAMMASAEEVRQLAGLYLPWVAFAALSSVLAFEMDGIFIGAAWSADMRNAMLASFVVFLPALVLLPRIAGNHGVWAALHVFLLARGVTLAARFVTRLRRGI
jgi:putative MATE family efflux protein